MAVLHTMFPPASSKPMSQYGVADNLGSVKSQRRGSAGSHVALLRDNFKIATWVFIGCVLQYILTLCLRPTLAVLPAFLFISWSAFDALLMTSGLKRNTWMEGVISGRFAAAYPAEGQRSLVSMPAENGPGAVMILGARSNSPLGMFAPGFKEIGDRFHDMVTQLEDEKKTSGFMGMSSWINTERSTSNESATISYWRSIDAIHNFAQSPVHREAWNWWNDATAKGKNSNLGIMHEIFEIPKENGFEGIYVNYHPTGLAATTRLVETGADSAEEWIIPIVDARRGQFRSSRGRLGRENDETSSRMTEKLEVDQYSI